MASSSEKEKAVLTELAGYTPLTLLDDIINTVNEVDFQALNALEDGFKQATPEQLGFTLDEKDAASLASTADKQAALETKKQNEIDSGMVKLETLLNSTVDKDFDKFEIYSLRNILTVGGEAESALVDYVTLDHYKNLDLGATNNSPTKEAVELQEKRLDELKKLNILLKVEEEKNKKTLDAIKGVEEKLEFMTKKTSDDANYTANQLPQVRELLAELKAARERLGDIGSNDGADPRQAYIDAQSRRATERAGFPIIAEASNTDRKTTDEIEGIQAVDQALAEGRQ